MQPTMQFSLAGLLESLRNRDRDRDRPGADTEIPDPSTPENRVVASSEQDLSLGLDIPAADGGTASGRVQLDDDRLDAAAARPTGTDPGDSDRDRDRGQTHGWAQLHAQGGRFDTNTSGETTTTPVASGRSVDIGGAFDISDVGSSSSKYAGLVDDQIQNLEQNTVEYSQPVANWIMDNDDLVPGILSRLSGLVRGTDGLRVAPADPDDEADQRLADHLRAIYDGDAEAEVHVPPDEVVETTISQNMMHAVFVARSTDLERLDLSTLDFARDGETGEEIYIQDPSSYLTFDVAETGRVEYSTETTDHERALIRGEDVFDVRLYRSPPLEAIATDVVNKLQLKRLKGRKAELASIGGIYITVQPPEWLPESDYEDRISEEDNPLGNYTISKLELTLQQDMEAALETLQSYQTATVMSVPSHWEVETIDLPEMDESFDEMIRGYNEAIARRLLYPFDLIELERGSELSRDTMMNSLLQLIAGWQGDLVTLFDNFARVQKDIHGLEGSVDHSFPSHSEEDEKQIIQLLNFAGLLGLSESEARQMANALEGVDLDEDPSADMPPAGGPDDPRQREQAMREMLDQEPTPETPERPQPASAQNIPGVDDPETGFRPGEPEGWTRSSVVQAWVSLGGTWRSCVSDMRGEIRSPERWCSALKDQFLGTENWRRGSASIAATVAASSASAEEPPSFSVDYDGSLGSFADALRDLLESNVEGEADTTVSTVNEEDDYVLIQVGAPTAAPADEDAPNPDAMLTITATGDGEFVVAGAGRSNALFEGLGDLEHVEGARPVPQLSAYRFTTAETLREAAQEVRREIEPRLDDGQTVEMRKKRAEEFAVLIRDRAGDFVGSMLVREAPDDEAGEWSVVGTTDVFSTLLANDSTSKPERGGQK